MKKLFIVLGVLFLALLMLFGIEYLIAYHHGPEFNAESKRYVDDAVPAILSTLDKRSLLDRASPEFVEKFRDGRYLDDWFADLKTLGEFKAYRGCSGYAQVMLPGMHVFADYVARAEFDSGVVEFTVRLMKGGHGWEIYSFTFDPRILIRKQKAPNTQ